MLLKRYETATNESPTTIQAPTIIPRPEHTISRAAISENALKVLYRLKNAGFEGYLVGGGVRDLLLGREPKDFDVVTDAHPEQIKALFRNCRLIGRRFRLAHVRFGHEVIEVATFRAHNVEAEDGDDSERVIEDGRILRDNVYGSFEEDAWRRDFSVNCLYYNIRDFSVVDFAGGMADLKNGTLRLIGEPAVRYREDPVRILRAVRFAAKLGFRLHPDSEAPIGELKSLVGDMPPARLYDEVLKMFLAGYALETFELLRHYDVFGELFPETEACLREESEGFPRMLLVRALENTDTRIQEGKPVTPAFLFAALLYEPMRRRAQALEQSGELTEIQAIEQAAADVLAPQGQPVALPRRFGTVTREIWALQPRLARRRGRQPRRLLAHPRFRAAYDFLLLRAQSGEDVAELVDYWTRAQEGEEPAVPPGEAPQGRRRKRRRGRRGRKADPASSATP